MKRGECGGFRNQGDGTKRCGKRNWINCFNFKERFFFFFKENHLEFLLGKRSRMKNSVIPCEIWLHNLENGKSDDKDRCPQPQWSGLQLGILFQLKSCMSKGEKTQQRKESYDDIFKRIWKVTKNWKWQTSLCWLKCYGWKRSSCNERRAVAQEGLGHRYLVHCIPGHDKGEHC